MPSFLQQQATRTASSAGLLSKRFPNATPWALGEGENIAAIDNQVRSGIPLTGAQRDAINAMNPAKGFLARAWMALPTSDSEFWGGTIASIQRAQNPPDDRWAKLGFIGASIITLGAASAGAAAAGGTAATETGGTVIANDFVGDLPIDSELVNAAPPVVINDNFVGDIPIDPNAGAAGAPSLPPGLSNALSAFGTKALDYALKRNLQNAAIDAAKSNATRAPNQANVSPVYSDAWKHPAGTQSGSLNSNWTTIAFVGIALLLIVVFFMRSK